MSLPVLEGVAGEEADKSGEALTTPLEVGGEGHSTVADRLLDAALADHVNQVASCR